MLRMILVRHGETDWNEARRVQGGNSDTPLNSKGRDQIERIGLRLKTEDVQAVYSSPLRRALDTARVIAGYHKLEVQIEPALKEVNVGALEGVPVSRLGKRLNELLVEQSKAEVAVGGGEGLWSRMPEVGGESLADLQQRAWTAIQRFVVQHAEGVIVVVSHYFVIMSVICSVLGLPMSQMGRLRFAVGSISTVVFDGQAPRLTLLNDTCHLAV